MPNKKRLPLHQSVLFKVTSPERLASFLHLDAGALDKLFALAPAYREFDKPKKGGGTRHCEEPVPSLKRVHSVLAKLLSRIEAPDFLFCPVKGRSYVSNAAAHRDSRVVHCLDIEKFFPNTSQQRVYWFFKTVLKCRGDVAGKLAALTTFNGHLATGSPVSPILAYFAFYDMWQEVEAFCKERGYVLTVYIDDVTVSGMKVPDSDIWQIKQIIHRFGLKYHKQKKFVDGAAEITGAIIKDGKVLVPHKQHRKRRLAVASLPNGTTDIEAAKRVIAGYDTQIRQIEAQNTL